MIENEFYDGARILDILASEAPLLNSRFIGCR